MAGGKTKSETAAVQPALFVVAILPETRLTKDGKAKAKSGPAQATHEEHLRMQENKGNGRISLIVLPKIEE